MSCEISLLSIYEMRSWAGIPCAPKKDRLPCTSNQRNKNTSYYYNLLSSQRGGRFGNLVFARRVKYWRLTTYKKVFGVREILIEKGLATKVWAGLPVTWEMAYPCFFGLRKSGNLHLRFRLCLRKSPLLFEETKGFVLLTNIFESLGASLFLQIT